MAAMHTRGRCHTAGQGREVLARWCLAGALALAGTPLASRVARADPLEGIELVWVGPPSCADHGELAAEARRLLPADGSYEATAIEIAVQELREHPGGGYRVALTARSASREADRVLELPTCEEAREAAGLLVALTLDPDALAAGESIDAAPTPEPTPAAQPPSPPPPASPPGPQRPASPGLGVELSAGAALDSSALPEVALGPFAAVGLRAGILRIALAGLYWPGAERPASADGSIRATLIAAQLGGCAMWRLSSALEAGACASAELGRYAARSRGVTHAESDATLWAAGSAGATAALALSRRLALVGSVSVLAPFRRPVLALREMDAAYVVPPVSLRAALGLRWF